MKMRDVCAFLLFLMVMTGSGSPDISDGSDVYSDLRDYMVDRQIISRGISDLRVLTVLRTVPRHLFIPLEYTDRAYGDYAVPIGYGQTISQPYIVALMTELLEVEDGDRILEIGTGSGYQAAVLSLLTSEVYSVEIISDLYESAVSRLESLGYGNVELKHGDGYYGWAEKGPFDKIIVTAAAGHVPPDLMSQLKPGGMIIIPIGRQFEIQYLTIIRKDSHGSVSVEPILPVRFVPFTGQAEK